VKWLSQLGFHTVGDIKRFVADQRPVLEAFIGEYYKERRPHACGDSLMFACFLRAIQLGGEDRLRDLIKTTDSPNQALWIAKEFFGAYKRVA
jgi:hypothetical protein